MPLGIAMLLYLTCAFALAMAGGIGLSAMFAPAERPEAQKQIIAKPPAQNPATRATVQKEPEPKTAPAPKAAASKPAGHEPVTETTGAARSPTWIAPTPSYNLPPPPAAQRAQQDAEKKKARQTKRKAPKQKQRPRHEPDDDDYGRATASAPFGRGPAYGYAERPRFFLFGGGFN
jgi:cytoskeletal protein RodZ